MRTGMEAARNGEWTKPAVASEKRVEVDPTDAEA